MITSQRQGDLGEASALEWLVSQGAYVFVPFGHSPNCDLMADMDGWPIRVQVKTSRYRRKSGYEVALATRGGNQSWTGVAKLFESSRCDYVFVVVADGRRWFIPAAEIAARHSIVVGGATWSRFEVDPGRPLVGSANPAAFAL
jgi:PD-(D/E)XK endonuclease